MKKDSETPIEKEDMKGKIVNVDEVESPLPSPPSTASSSSTSTTEVTSTSPSISKTDPDSEKGSEPELERVPQPTPTTPKQSNAWGKKCVTFAPPNSHDKNVYDNVYAASSDSMNKARHKLSFKDIMMQEEQKSMSEAAAFAGDYDDDAISEDIMNQIQSMETEEERMIRLAIEASLKDVNVNANDDVDLKKDYQLTNPTENVPTSDSDSDSLPALISQHDDYQYEYDADTDDATKIFETIDNVGAFSVDNDDDDMDEDMKLAIRLSLAEMSTHNVPHSQATRSGNVAGVDSIDMGMNMDGKPSAEEQMKLKMMTQEKHIDDDPYSFSDQDQKMPPPSAHSLDDTLGHKSIAASESLATTTATSDYTAATGFATVAASASASASATSTTTATSTSTVPGMPPSLLSQEEQESITRAILAADDAEEAQSLKLAMELQAEEDRNHARRKVELLRNNNTHSNVRTVSRSEFEVHGIENHASAASSSRKLWGQDDYEQHNEYYGPNIHWEEAHSENHGEGENGFQINASTPNKTWSKIDRNTIVGPNNEIRTKHDVALKNKANADRLLLNSGGINMGAAANGGKKSSTAGLTSVSDAAYSSFTKSVKKAMKRSVVKGVERSGTGRAENMNEKTRGGAMDGNVRLLITRAINNGLIRHCNGVVKEGKEAIVYHAEANNDLNDSSNINNVNGDFDVAVKVFKRIQEFKGRGEYMDNDPRYHGKKFRNAAKREQVELWAEKEYRNLIRASRGGVPVPLPIMHKENVLFMRFLGENGWPAPQLRELDIKRGSKKWTVLYCQTCMALRRLYHCARLVHADISEYNILVCPMSQVFDDRQGDSGSEELQIVLIDFGQAVERNHPSAIKYLRRDLSLIRSFFSKQYITTLTDEECEEFIVKEPVVKEDELTEADDDDTSANADDDNDEASQERVSEWRHDIKGWDVEKDLAWLEERLAHLKKSAKI